MEATDSARRPIRVGDAVVSNVTGRAAVVVGLDDGTETAALRRDGDVFRMDYPRLAWWTVVDAARGE